MLDWFDYHGHICLTFDMLGLSVFDFLVSEGWIKVTYFEGHAWTCSQVLHVDFM